MEVCSSEHKTYKDNNTYHQEQIEKGLKPVRTKGSGGYQTAYILKELNEKDAKDKPYNHVVLSHKFQFGI